MQSLSELHSRFIRERNYLDNLSPKTIRFLKQSWGSLTRLLPTVDTIEDLRAKVNTGEFVIALRKSNVRPVTCNTYIRGINCFLSWLNSNGFLESRLAIKQLRAENTIPKIVDGYAFVSTDCVQI